MIEWKDETTHSRSTIDRVPRVWAARAGDLKMTVHRHIHHAPAVWCFTCAPWFDCYELPSPAAPIAKSQALELLREKLQSVLGVLVA
jgi:hypothetical protein